MRIQVPRSPRTGRAPLVAALVLALLVGGLAILMWQLRPEGVTAALPQATAQPQAEVDGPRLADVGIDDAGESTEGDANSLRQERTAATAPGTEQVEWSGTVRDALSGTAVADARVALAFGELEEAVQTDASGRFTLAWPAQLEAALALEHPAYVDVRAPSVDLAREGHFALQPSARLRGRIDPPPAGQDARALAWLEAASSQRYWDALEAPVASDGTFVLADLDPGDYVVTAVVPGHFVAPQAGLHLERGETLELVLRAEPAARVEGVVLRMPQARGVPAARVAAVPRDDDLPRDWRGAVSVETTSDDRGHYTLAGLGPGRWRVEVQTPWGVELRRDLDVPGSGEHIELDLEVPGPSRLSGRVSDAAGRGVEGARVVAVTGRRLSGLDRLAAGEVGDAPATTSGPSGAFSLDEAPSRTDLVLVALALPAGGDGPPRLGFAPVQRLQADEVRGGIEIVLGDGLSVQGRVLGPQGEAVSMAEVGVSGRPGGLRGTLGRAVSDEEGHFTLEGLPAGNVMLHAQHPDWLAGWITVDPSVNTGEVEIRMRPAFVVEGLALDTQGFGVANLPIGFQQSDASGQVNERRSRNRGRRAVTDEFGRFRMTDLPEGSWVASGSSYEWQQVNVQPAVVATPGDSFVTLTFAPRERPLRAEIRGELALAGGGTPTGVRIEGLRGGVLSIDGGQFRATGLTPTRHRLTLRAAGHATMRTGAIDLPPGHVHDLGRIVLEPAAVLTVLVRSASGQPLDRARVRLVPLPPGEGGPGQGGRTISLRGRGRGRYSTTDATLHAWRLVVDRNGYQRSARRLEIDSQERLQVEVKLQPRPATGG